MRVLPTARPSCRCAPMPVGSAHAAANPKAGYRSAEHGIAVDRCARDRWLFDSLCGARAAADGQAVGRRLSSLSLSHCFSLTIPAQAAPHDHRSYLATTLSVRYTVT